jgi:acetyl esterase/lipase
MLVHGGGWIGGGSRFHLNAKFLYELVSRGWIVACPSYRRGTWPQHVNDCRLCLDELIDHAVERGGSVDNIHLCGVSSGGHIASQLVCELNISRPSFKPASLVLLYPVTDPLGSKLFSLVWPFNIPLLKIRSGQTLRAWLFEIFVAKASGDLTEEQRGMWSPLSIMTDEVDKLSCSAVANTSHLSSQSFCWPRTYIVHGELDSVVPVEQSMLFIAKLRELRYYQSSIRPSRSGGPERVISAASPIDPLAMGRSSGYQVVPAADIVVRSVGGAVESLQPTAPVTSSVPSDGDCDDFLVVPSGRHTLELSGPMTVKIINELVVDWLQH